MEIIITESQLIKLNKMVNEQDSEKNTVKPIKKFNRSSDTDYGKYGKSIENLAFNYFKGAKLDNGVCDIICIKIPNDDSYILMVLMSHYINESNLQKYIETFIPKGVMVMVNVDHHCGDSK